MTTDVSLGELIQRLHALGSAIQPTSSSSSSAASLRPSPAKPASVSAFHIHPTFSPSLLSTVAARAGLPPLAPPAASQPPSPSIRHHQSDRFIQALLARHEQSLASSTIAKLPAAVQSPDAATPATPAARSSAADASVLSPSTSSSAAAGRALLHSLILRYTGSALPQKRSPARSSSRKHSTHSQSPTTDTGAPPSERSSSPSPSSLLSPSLPVPPPSSSSSSLSSRHHRQLFTRSSSSVTPTTISSSPSSSAASQSAVQRPKRSSSSAGSTARQRASVEVEKAQLKAAAEAARNAARSTEMAASLLINATGSRAAAADSQPPSSSTENEKVRKRERLSSSLDTAQPGARELLRLSSAGDKPSLDKQRDASSLQQQPKRRRTERAGQTEGKTAAQTARPGRKRKERSDDNGAHYNNKRRQAVKSAAAKPAAGKTSHTRVEQRADVEQYSADKNTDTSGDSADEDTDGSGERSYYSYDSEVESDNDHSRTSAPLTRADSRGASLLAAGRSSSFASRLSSPLMVMSGTISSSPVSVVSSASFAVPALSSGPTPLARTSSRGGRLRGSPLLS